MKNISISAVVNTCNEERYIGQCLEHLRWADEIIVVDMHSEDNTVEICRKYTDKIYLHRREISVLYARNFALSKATGDWILVVDPDEIFPPSLCNKIMELINAEPEFTAIAVPYKNRFLGRILTSYPATWQKRCFRKGHVSYPPRVHSQPTVNGEIYSLPYEDACLVIHDNYDSVSQFIQKMNRYTSDEADHMYRDDGIRFSIYNLIRKPLSEFIHQYILRRSYRDGIEGFFYSALMSVYRFTTYAKLWDIEKNERTS